MKEWKYLIGSADDFIGAPEWALLRLARSSGSTSFAEGFTPSSKRTNVYDVNLITYLQEKGLTDFSVIAQRTESFGNAIDLEFCKANPDHPDCKCKEIEVDITDQQAESMQRSIDEFSKASGFSRDAIIGRYETYTINIDDRPSKYSRPCKGITLDVYDVLQAFAVTNPATQHAIKKLLCAGLRGHKDKMQDLTEALKSIERAIELEKE